MERVSEIIVIQEKELKRFLSFGFDCPKEKEQTELEKRPGNMEQKKVTWQGLLEKMNMCP